MGEFCSNINESGGDFLYNVNQLSQEEIGVLLTGENFVWMEMGVEDVLNQFCLKTLGFWLSRDFFFF